MDALRTPGTVVFVATGWPQRTEGAALMRLLEQRGLRIACDWTSQPATNKKDTSVRDVAAMQQAQVLVAVMTLSAYAYKGTWTEVGMALGRGIPVVLVSPFVEGEADCAKNVYFHHPSFLRFASADALLQAIMRR